MALSSEELSRSNLYHCRRKRDLARILGISRGQLRWLTKQPNTYPTGRSQSSLYTRLWKPKKGDGRWLRDAPDIATADNYRPIDNPIDLLKSVQRRVHDDLSALPVPDWLYAPALGKSYVDNAAAHIGSTHFHLLDLQAYFTSCRAARVFAFFKGTLLCSSDVAGMLTHITTLDGSLPQGAPSSPVLSYFSNHQIWDTVHNMCIAEHVKQTLYGDDITMSANRPISGKLIWDIKRTLHSHGLQTKKRKEVHLSNKPADITGVIVDEKGIQAPNRQFKRLSEVELQAKLEPENKKLANKIKGRRAQIKQIINTTDVRATVDGAKCYEGS